MGGIIVTPAQFLMQRFRVVWTFDLKYDIIVSTIYYHVSAVNQCL